VVHVHNYVIGVIAMSMGGVGLKIWWTGPLFEGDDAAIQVEVDWVVSVFGTLDSFHKKTHRIHGDAHLENYVKCNGGTEREKPIIIDLGRSKLIEKLPIERAMFDVMKLIDLLYMLKFFYTSPRHRTVNEINKWMKLHEALHTKFSYLFGLYLKSMDGSMLLIQKCVELFGLVTTSSDDRARVHDGGEGDAYQSPIYGLSDVLCGGSPITCNISAKEDDPTIIYISELDKRSKMLQTIFRGKWFKITRNGERDERIKEGDECSFSEILSN